MKKTMAGRWRLLWVAAVLGVAWVSGAIAQEYPSFYRGVRPLAMGGAFTAVADDENALYYNAAGLADISMLNLAVLNPLVEGTEDGMEMYQDLQDTDFETVEEGQVLIKSCHLFIFLSTCLLSSVFWSSVVLTTDH